MTNPTTVRNHSSGFLAWLLILIGALALLVGCSADQSPCVETWLPPANTWSPISRLEVERPPLATQPTFASPAPEASLHMLPARWVDGAGRSHVGCADILAGGFMLSPAHPNESQVRTYTTIAIAPGAVWATDGQGRCFTLMLQAAP